VSLECAAPFTFWSKYKLKMTFPFMLLVFVLLNGSVFVVVSTVFRKQKVDFHFLRQRCASFFLQTVVSCYTLIISGATSPLICLKQADGSETLVRNPSISCRAGEWNIEYPTIVFFLVLYAGIFPILLLFVLIINRKKLEHPQMIVYFGSFTRQYKPDFFWWEIVFLIKRAMFVAVSGLIPARPGDSTPYFACIFLLFGYMSIELFVNPFRQTLTAKRSAMWYFVAVLVLMSDALVFKNDESSNFIKLSWSIVMLLLIVLSFSTVILTLFRLFKRRRKKQNISEINGLSSKLEFESTGAKLKLLSLEGLEEVANVDIEDIEKVVLFVKTNNGTGVRVSSPNVNALL
jgi:hypothetical protein